MDKNNDKNKKMQQRKEEKRDKEKRQEEKMQRCDMTQYYKMPNSNHHPDILHP